MNLDLPNAAVPLARAAEIYAEQGLPVFPLRGKVPLLKAGDDRKGGFHDATVDLDQVRAWWRAHPRANIGVPMGGDRQWFAFDVERVGIATREQLEREHGPLPLTLRARTGGGGEHWIFTAPDASLLVNRARVAEGCDVRTTGGYIAVAPSVHPDTGVVYEWDCVVEPQPAPAWLLAILPHKAPPAERPRYVRLPDTRFDASKRERYAMAVLRGEAEKVSQAGSGARNDTLNYAWWRVAQFRDVIPESQARAVLREAGLACGLPEREVDQVLR